MRGLQIALVVLACAACTTVAQQRRVVRVRQRVLAAPQEEEQQPEPLQAQARSAQADPDISYYHVVPESNEYQEPQQRPVARPAAPAAYRPRADGQRLIQAGPRTKDSLATKAPPVQTIRNYNTINDDGSFTFGYEAADGSFKEETRGVDCVVRGKYGYIDPDGNKREFTYVSGNPCDPNNPDEDDRSVEEEDESEEENVPVRRPVVRPNVSRTRPAANPAPSTAVFQNAYQGQRLNSIEQPVAVTPRPVARPVTPRPVLRQQTVYTPEPAPPAATTYRPQIQNYPTVTSTVAPVTKAAPAPANLFSVSPSPGPVDFDAELKRFELKSAPTPASRPQTTFQASPFTPTAQPTRTAAPAAPARQATGNPFYNSQLIYDPATGQYNTVLYQQLPKGVGDYSLNTRLQPYVHQPQQYQPQQYQPQLPQQPSPFAPSLQSLRAGPSAPTPARYPANVIGAPHGGPPQQSFYYINPNLRNQFSTGQIDSFLKGHNLQI